MKARLLLYFLLLMLSVIKVRANDDGWNHNPYAYQYDMTVYIALGSVDGKDVSDESNYLIGAFCDDECRGIAEEKNVSGHKYLYLRVRSNKSDGETIGFKVKNPETGKIANVAKTIDFKSQQTIGYPSSPFLIDAINKYRITFIIDGVEQSTDLYYGDAITIPAAPTKTGYTFTGWDKDVPSTIPAEDVTVKAQWTINQYTITFDTDGGGEIAPITQDYNSTVTVPATPTKTGYTFAGWDKEIPATIPAEDITITALWTINKYKLTYKVDGEVYKQYEIEYNAGITPEENPIKEGYKFSGWSEIPEFMPEHDVEVYGTFDIVTGINNVKYDSDNEKRYDLSGNVIKQMRKGINIVKGKKILVK